MRCQPGVPPTTCLVNLVRRVKITHPDVSEHLLEVVCSGAECEMVENVLLHVLDVRIHQSDASLILTHFSFHD